jgi:tRNA(adenine34) deaminase
MSPVGSMSLAAEGLAADEQLVRAALEAAVTTPPTDVPVGALVIAPDGSELSRACNTREATGDPTAHAEVRALRAAAARHGDGWRLSGCTLVVTVEPCTMCAGAAVLARVERIVFGAWEPRTGAVGSLWDVVRDRRLTHRPRVRGGVLEAECAELLQGFFRGHRAGAGANLRELAKTTVTTRRPGASVESVRSSAGDGPEPLEVRDERDRQGEEQG